jgi:hypothetical protein
MRHNIRLELRSLDEECEVGTVDGKSYCERLPGQSRPRLLNHVTSSNAYDCSSLILTVALIFGE